MTITTRRRRQPEPATKTILTLAIAGALLTICACSRSPTLPDGFEEVASSTLAGQKVIIARDTGTGCEIVLAGTGVMPRNERSGDGASVKQRCVNTGSENASTTPASVPVVDTTIASQQAADSSSAAATTPTSVAMPATSATPAPANNPAQDEAVARAVQETVTQTPPASSASGRVPPPSGRRSSRPIKVARPPLTTPVVGSDNDGEEQQ